MSETRWKSADKYTDGDSLDQFHYRKARKRGSVAEPYVSGSESNSSVKLAEKYVDNQKIDSKTLSQVSDYRQEYIRQLLDKNNAEQHKPLMPLYKKGNFTKTATVMTGAGNVAHSANTVRISPELYHPLYLTQNLHLPRDIITANSWNRAYYETNPIVRNAINLHATYPISKLSIKCEEKDVERFFNDMAEKVDLQSVVQTTALEFWKCGEMLHGGAFVTMHDGSVRPIKDIKVGDLVLTHLGNKKRVIETLLKPVSRLQEEKINIFKMKIHGLPDDLIISGNHPVLSANKGYFTCPTKSCSAKGMRVLPGRTHCSNCHKPAKYNEVNPDFALMSELEEEDIVYAPFNETVVDDSSFTEDLCYIVGQWIAEGCYCKDTHYEEREKIGIKFCSYDEKYIFSVLEPLIEKSLSIKPVTYISDSTGFKSEGYKDGKTRKKYDTWCYGKKKNGCELADFFMKHCGEYSKSKKFSNEIMELPPALQVHILAGFIDGDGCVDKDNGHVLFCTSSKALSNQMLLMLRRAGAHPTMSKVAARPDKNYAEQYRIRLVATESYNLFKGKLKTEKDAKLRQAKWSSPRSGNLPGLQVLSIASIENITEEYDQEVMYDLEVEDDHSYVANGIAVHNCFVYAAFDENGGTWKNVYHHNPDFISVKQAPIPGVTTISLKPDPELQKIITSSDPAHARIRESLDPKIVHHVLMNEYIPLDSFNISHLKNLSSPYDIRGTSIITSVWKDLIQLDKIREAKFAQADSMINPMTLFKVGASNPDGFYPTQQELDNYREILESAEFDKNFKLVTHDAVSVERIGYNGGILDTNQDVQTLTDNIFMGLMIPKAVVTQEGATYASASVALDVMRQRYMNFRHMMANWLVQKIFAPIAEVQGFYKVSSKTKKLIVPEVEWNHMTLYDLDSYIGNIVGLVDKKQVSLKTLHRSLGLNLQEEDNNIRSEMIRMAILKKEEMELGKLSLSELRALDPEKPIPEQEKQPLPGTPGSLPGMDMGGGLPGMGGGMGGPPPGGGGLPGMDMGGAPGGMGGGPPMDLGGAPPGGPPPGGATPPGSSGGLGGPPSSA